MILPDANLLLYAEDESSPRHAAASAWWREQLSGVESVALSWPVVCAFIRLATNPRVFAIPLTEKQACDRVGEWLEQPQVSLVHPTENHWAICRELIVAAQCRGNLVTDAHLAALAIEYGCVLCSSDRDFSRFRRLKWRNPLAS